MRFEGKFLALFVLHSSLCGTGAFMLPGRPALAARKTVAFSYLDSMNGDSRPNGANGLDSAPPAPPTSGKDSEKEMRDLEGRLASRLAKLEQNQNPATAPRAPPAPGRAFTPDPSSNAQFDKRSDPEKVWDTSKPIIVQGGSLRTWSFASPSTERVQVHLTTDGRPLDADVELWHGPDNTPHKMKVYIEDGSLRPFCAVMETPRGPNTIAVRNTGHLEFPMTANVGPDFDDSGLVAVTHSSDGVTVQGGALRTYPFDPTVDSVKIFLKTDGRPLNARIELLQGPNNNKQVVELYTEDGLDRPFFAILETPGSGNVVKVTNTAPVEFPLIACVEPYQFGNGDALYEDGIMLGRQW